MVLNHLSEKMVDIKASGGLQDKFHEMCAKTGHHIVDTFLPLIFA